MNLSIDTSTRYATVALGDDGKVISELSWYSNQNHTVELVPNIELLLRRSEIEYSSISAIGVAIGPGNFSAVRVALSVAKGLAIALGVPVAPASTLLIEAYPYLASGFPVVAMIGAGRGQVVAASYQKVSDGTLIETPKQLLAFEDLVSVYGADNSKPLLCGEGMGSMTHDELESAGKSFVMAASDMGPSRHASSIIHLLTQGHIGLSEDVATIEPIYARSATITAPKVA